MRGTVRCLAFIGWVFLGAVGLMLVARHVGGESWFERVYWGRLPLVGEPQSPWALLVGAFLVALDVAVLVQLLFGGRRPKRMTFKDSDGDELAIDLAGIEHCLDRMLAGEEGVRWAQVEVDVSEAKRPRCHFKVGLDEGADLKARLRQLKAKVVARFEELLRLGTQIDVRAEGILVPARRVPRRAGTARAAAATARAPEPAPVAAASVAIEPELAEPASAEFRGIEYPVDRGEEKTE